MRFNKYVFVLTILLQLASSALIFAQEVKKNKNQLKTEPPKLVSMYLEYSTPFNSIQIQNGLLIFSEISEEFDNPISAIPTNRSVQTRTIIMSDEELKQILEYIENLGFMSLENEYGAPQKERHYPYSIKLKLNNVSKEVIYRSNPQYDHEPEEFRAIGAFLSNLVNSVKVWDDN